MGLGNTNPSIFSTLLLCDSRQPLAFSGSCLLLTTMLRGRAQYLCFIDKEMEAEREKQLAQGNRAVSKRQSGDSSPRLLGSQSTMGNPGMQVSSG